MKKIFTLLKILKRELCMFLFGLFPVKANRILFMSYYGKHMNCNPYAIYCFLKEHHPEYDFVWVYNKKTDETGIKAAPFRSIKFYYFLRTSKFLIFNARPNMDIRKKKDQFYIQTWHSSLGFKKIEKDAAETLSKSYIKNSKKDSTHIDLLISGCRFRSECFKRNFWYAGEIAEIGTPRNDILFSDKKKDITLSVKEELKIAKESKIALYAPTFRNSGDVSYAQSLNVDKLKEVLQKKFSGNWEIVFRLHPNVSFEGQFDSKIINASDYNDMQGLLLASDLVITDYSSLMFDFMLLRRPCFLYCPDLEQYTSSERKTYFSLDELPFDLATTSELLVENIANLDLAHYMEKLNSFLEYIGSFEEGTACKKIAETIKNHL